jgi:hypothetical protein
MEGGYPENRAISSDFLLSVSYDILCILRLFARAVFLWCSSIASAADAPRARRIGGVGRRRGVV